jgi:hypothetical protein
MAQGTYIAFLDARIKLLERVWGTDTEYLKNHREEYLTANNNVHKSLVRELLRLGRTQEARKEIGRKCQSLIKI